MESDKATTEGECLGLVTSYSVRGLLAIYDHDMILAQAKGEEPPQGDEAGCCRASAPAANLN